MRVEYSSDNRNNSYLVCEQIIGFDGRNNYLNYVAYPGKIYQYGKVKGITSATIGIPDLGYNLSVQLKYYPGTASANRCPEMITGVSVVRIFLQPEYDLVIIEAIGGTYHIKASDIRNLTVR